MPTDSHVPGPSEQGVLKQNIEARENAEYVASYYEDQPKRFWELLKAECERRLPKPEPLPERLPALTESEAIKFEEQLFHPRSKYSDSRVWQVAQFDPEYIIYWDEGDDFTKMVHRYVKSERFRRRLRDE